MSVALQRLRDSLRAAVDALDEAIREDEWVDQAHSPLGRRAHLAAVRAGKLVGRKVAGRMLVRRSEVDAFIEKHRQRPKVLKPEASDEEAIADVLSFRAPRRRGAP